MKGRIMAEVGVKPQCRHLVFMCVMLGYDIPDAFIGVIRTYIEGE